jgi:hypothetical protein
MWQYIQFLWICIFPLAEMGGSCSWCLACNACVEFVSFISYYIQYVKQMKQFKKSSTGDSSVILRAEIPALASINLCTGGMNAFNWVVSSSHSHLHPHCALLYSLLHFYCQEITLQTLHIPMPIISIYLFMQSTGSSSGCHFYYPSDSKGEVTCRVGYSHCQM